MSSAWSSKRHKLVGTILKSSPYFSHMRIKEEVPVSKLVPDFPDNRKRVDWYIKDLRLVIEVHGEQHYKPVAFGGRDAKQEFIKQIHRDIEKQAAIENANYLFLEIPCWVKISEDWLWEAIHEVMEKFRHTPKQSNKDTSNLLQASRSRFKRSKKTGPSLVSRPFPRKQKKLKSRPFPKKPPPNDHES